VQDRGNLGDAFFEDAEGTGIGEHQRSDVVGDEFAQVIGVNLAAAVGFDVLDFVSGDYDGSRIGAVRGIGDQNLPARVAALRQQRADHQQRGQFPLGAGGGLQRHGIHARDLRQRRFEARHYFHGALRQRFGLVGMRPRQPIQPRHHLVHARVVLHRARTERVHA